MKATKYRLTITAEALSKDSLRGLVARAMEAIGDEEVDGGATYDDGDSVSWRIESEDVEF